jgi:hypothetical protein
MSKPDIYYRHWYRCWQNYSIGHMVEHLQADYWKPVQAGDLENSDTIKVQR